MEMEMEFFRAHEVLIGCLINNFQSLEIEINCLSDVEEGGGPVPPSRPGRVGLGGGGGGAKNLFKKNRDSQTHQKNLRTDGHIYFISSLSLFQLPREVVVVSILLVRNNSNAMPCMMRFDLTVFILFYFIF
jgi:hypothetical protein